MKKIFCVCAMLASIGEIRAADIELNPWDFFYGKGHLKAVIRIDSTQDITENLTALAALIDVSAPIPQNAFLMAAHVRTQSSFTDDLVSVGGVIEADGQFYGPVEFYGASIYANGIFEDSLEANGAVVFVTGHLKGPVYISAAEIYVEDGAIIEDTLRYNAGVLHQSDQAQLLSGSRQVIIEPKEEDETKVPRKRDTFGHWLVNTILSYLFLAGAGLFLSLVLPGHFKDATSRIHINPGFSALAGGIAGLAAPFALLLVILLLISVIGAGAGLFIAVFYAAGFLFSSVYAGTSLGRWLLSLSKRDKRKKKEPHIILSMLLGVLITLVLIRIPYVGWIFWAAAFVFGFGSLLLSWWLAIKRPSAK